MGWSRASLCVVQSSREETSREQNVGDCVHHLAERTAEPPARLSNSLEGPHRQHSVLVA